MKKRIYGEGSITYRGKEERWQISVPDAEGGRRYGYAKSEKEAEKVRRQLLAEVEQGKLPASKQPFKAHVEEWLEMKRKGKDYRPNSYRNVWYLFEAHFLPAFGHIPLNKLSAAHIQKLYNKLLGQKLNPNTLRQYHNNLKVCLDSAVKQGKLECNPCSRVELPRKVKSKNNFFSQEDAMLVLDACKSDKLFKVLIPLALATEARKSELLALTWDDVNLEQGTISISKTLTMEMDNDRHLRLLVGDPKSESGIRTITLPPFAIDVLKGHRLEQLKMLLATGTGQQNTLNLVFPNRRWGYRWPEYVSFQYKRFVTTLGLDDTRFHDLRHTGATLLLDSGIAANVVQKRLGHSDIRTTLGIYGHVTQKMKDQAADTLDNLLTDRGKGDFEAI